jgi:hypothetical protein
MEVALVLLWATPTSGRMQMAILQVEGCRRPCKWKDADGDPSARRSCMMMGSVAGEGDVMLGKRGRSAGAEQVGTRCGEEIAGLGRWGG